MKQTHDKKTKSSDQKVKRSRGRPKKLLLENGEPSKHDLSIEAKKVVEQILGNYDDRMKRRSEPKVNLGNSHSFKYRLSSIPRYDVYY